MGNGFDVSLTFLTVFWGALAAASAPVIIHLLLRSRPRRITFPALQFVRKSYRTQVSKLRLKHLLLLALRVLAIVLIGLLLARALLPAWATAPQAGAVGPVAVVLVLDDSASMRYRQREGTSFQKARRLAEGVLKTVPPGSRMLVLSASGSVGGAEFLNDRRFASREVARLNATYSSAPLGGAIQRAAAALGTETLAAREVIVFTDMTARAFSDLAPPPAEGVRYYVVPCGAEENLNLALGELRSPGGAQPLGRSVRVDTDLVAGQVGAELTLAGAIDGVPLPPKPLTVPAEGSIEVELGFRPQRRGVLHGQMEIRHDDPLEMDNRRYFTLLVGAPAAALVVRDRSTIGQADATYRATISALSAAGRWLSVETIAHDRLAAEALKSRRLVVLAGVSALAEAQWKALEAYVRAGGGLLVLPGPLSSPEAYATDAASAVLPAEVEGLQRLDSPVALQAAEENHPLVADLSEAVGESLNEVRAVRRFRLSAPRGRAQAVVRFADGSPAIVQGPLDAGQVALWATGPDRQFSNITRGFRLTFLVLMLRTAEQFGFDAGAARTWTWGQQVQVPVPPGMRADLALVQGPGGEEPFSAPVGASGVLRLAAEQIGPWTVTFQGPDANAVTGFSVNAPDVESELTSLSAEEVQARFGAAAVEVIADPSQRAAAREARREPLDLTLPLVLAVLAALVGEAFLANRFYRQPGPEEAA